MLVQCDAAKYTDPIMSMLGMGGAGVELETGVYEVQHFGYSHFITHDFDKHYPAVGDDFYCQGVCDDYKQVLEQCKELQNPDRKFVLTVKAVNKDSEPAEGGWRWHKWGDYIGTKNPRHEYLYDEDDSIQVVYCYHIYEL